jgi:signal transduction histidine kinase
MSRKTAMMSRVSFRTKISITMIAVLLLLGVSLALIISRTASRALLDESKKRGISSALHVGARIGEPLLATDYLRMKDLVDEAIRTSEDVSFVFILGKNGRPLVHSFTGGFPVDLAGVNEVENSEAYRVKLITTGEELIYDFAVPVVIGNERLGTVRFGVSHKRIGGAVDRLLLTIFAATAISVVIAALFGTILARTMTKRIDLLQLSAEEIVNGNLDIQTLPSPKLSCWKFMGCDKRECPAYGESRHRCWYVAGTLCPSCVEGEYAKKIDTCRNCAVYRINSGDEIQHLAEHFDLMAMTLKRRMEDLEAIQERMVQSQKLESLGQLAAGVAHELNTPLGIVLGYTQLMLKDFSEDSEYHEWLKIQEKHLRTCKRIVSDLLRFSRTTETDKKPLDLNDSLEQVMAVVEHTFGLEKISLEREFAPDLPPIFGDREKLQQVFLNLLNNAHHAIGSDGRVIVTTDCDREKGEVVVSVADTGSGIPSEVLPKIFDPFFTTKPVGKGTGLGLSVTFGIVKDHGGHIEVESHVHPEEAEPDLSLGEHGREKGTIFTLRFPVHGPIDKESVTSEQADRHS